MKSKYFLFLTIILISCSGQKKLSQSKGAEIKYEYKALESFKNDTLNYVLYNFINHKNQYIGKHVSVLFDKLQYEIKSFQAATDDTGAVYSILVSYLTGDQYSFRLHERLKMVDICITFENPIRWLTVLNLSPRGHFGEWSSKNQDFLGTQIVKDIRYLAIPNDVPK